MVNALKKIGFFFLVLIISAGFYWLIFMDRATKQDTLESAMGLLGDKLMAMIPDSTEKKPVQALYDSFSQRAVQREMPPEQIEYVAASILNLSNTETMLTPEQVKTILNIPFFSPVKLEREANDSIEVEIEKKKFIQSGPERPIPPERWEALGERIKSLNEFNAHMQKTMKEVTDQHQKVHRQIRYRVDKELKIAMDADLKTKFHHKKFRHLAKEIRRMEREHMLEWRENFQDELKQEMEQMKKELESLKELKKLKQLEHMQGLEALKSLESLKSLELLKNIPVIDADSINKIVNQSLKDAGLIPEENE